MPQLIASVEGVEIRRVYLTRDRTTLGRKPGNDIVLDNLAVSGHHCVFELHGLADVFVQDLGSTNGTFVNNHRVKRQQLHDADVLAIAGFRIRYLTASAESGYRQTTAMELEHTGQMPATGPAIFQVINGSSVGLEVPLVKAVTTFGKPDVAVVSVSHRRTGYFITRLAGVEPPLLNGSPVGDEPLLLSSHDVLELGATKMLFRLQG